MKIFIWIITGECKGYKQFSYTFYNAINSFEADMFASR